MLVLILAASAAACASPRTPPAAASGPETPTAATPRATPAATTTENPDGVIPVEAFADPAIAMRAGPVRERVSDRDALPALCGGGAFSAGDDATARASVRSFYKRPEDPTGSVPHGVLYQTITSYRADGARRFMTRVRGGLRACPSYRAGGLPVRVRVFDFGDRLADDSIRVDVVVERGKRQQTNVVVVLRHGDVVTVLRDQGWEGTSSVPGIVDSFLRDALIKLDAWR
jgi:hypothetical protein